MVLNLINPEKEQMFPLIITEARQFRELIKDDGRCGMGTQKSAN